MSPDTDSVRVVGGRPCSPGRVEVALTERGVVHRSAGRRPADRSVLLQSRSPAENPKPDGGAVPTALDVVDGEVRELIRRRGLDPFTDPAPVRVLVRDVVADYSERSLSSALPPIADPESVVRDVLDRVAGFGALQRYFDDPEVQELSANEPGRAFVAPRGRSELTPPILGPGAL